MVVGVELTTQCGNITLTNYGWVTPSHYLNQCWLIISKVQWHSSEHNCTRDTLPPPPPYQPQMGPMLAPETLLSGIIILACMVVIKAPVVTFFIRDIYFLLLYAWDWMNYNFIIYRWGESHTKCIYQALRLIQLMPFMENYMFCMNECQINAYGHLSWVPNHLCRKRQNNDEYAMLCS